MTTNDPRGGVSSTSGRSDGRRQNNAENGAAPLPLERGRLAVSTAKLALDRGPGGDPLVVRDAALAAVRARRQRRLPELDRVEISSAGLVGVVLRARAGLKRFHLGARLRVDRRLAEEQRLLRLHLGGADVGGPEVGAVGVRRLGRQHPRVTPSGGAFR